MRTLRPGIGLLILGTAICTGQCCIAQSSRLPPPAPNNPTQQPPMGPDDVDEPHDATLGNMRQQLEKARNQDRQKQLVQDTQKLLTLATELKTDVDKTNQDTLSIDVIKKADEIEKLAHSVKEKMKGS